MKSIKKHIIVSLFVLTLISFIGIKPQLKAADMVEDQTKTSTFQSNVTTNESIYGMTHIIDEGIARTSNASYQQSINYFEMKTDGLTSKLVTWAVQDTNYSYKRTSIIEAARDYEKNNPGWIVLGGINADQYTTKMGTSLVAGESVMAPMPYYPMITDGDNRFTVTVYNNSTSIVGFTNDGSVNSFAKSTGYGGYQLTVIDEGGEEIQAFTLAGINQNAEANQTTVWSSHFSTQFQNRAVAQEVTTTNKLYVVEDAELAYMSIHSSYGYTHNEPDTLFCRGYISNDTATSYTLENGQFAIETTNEEVIEALQKGVRIKVEQLFQDVLMNKCDEGIGYHSVQIQNNVDNMDTAWSQNPYNSKQYPRALVGKKADGTYVLITADSATSRKTRGLNFTQINALAHAYDVTDLYQMDGGGSVTAMIRNADGTFSVSNCPSDSNNPAIPRANLSYLFFVKRDPGVAINQDLTTYHSITLSKETTFGKGIIENLKVKLGSDIYTFDSNNQITIDQLQHNQEYTLKVSYDVVTDTKTVSDEYEITVKTLPYQFPTTPFTISQITDTSITVIKQETEVSNNISNVVVIIGKKEYSLGSGNEIVCSDLQKGNSYEISYRYDIYDEPTKMTYTTTTTPFTITTLNFTTPAIELYEESIKTKTLIGIKYKYADPDSKVTKAYIEYGTEKFEITSKTGTATIQNLDFENNSYEFKLVLEYEDEAGNVQKVESEVLKYIIEVEEPDPTPEKKKCGKKSAELIIASIAVTSSLGLVLRKKK